MTEAQKQELADFEAAGKHVFTVAYDPTTVTGDPEADAVAAGLVEYYREDSANLVEVVYHEA